MRFAVRERLRNKFKKKEKNDTVLVCVRLLTSDINLIDKTCDVAIKTQLYCILLCDDSSTSVNETYEGANKVYDRLPICHGLNKY